MAEHPEKESYDPMPVAGYTQQSGTAIHMVNVNKETEEIVLRLLDQAEELTKTGEFEFDRRWLAIARTHIEQGFMALNRAIFKPQRIKLPEDEQRQEKE